jgi:hypothetical protein
MKNEICIFVKLYLATSLPLQRSQSLYVKVVRARSYVAGKGAVAGRIFIT